jgi:hypothetical protein
LESTLEHIAHLPPVIAPLAALDCHAPGATDQIVALNRCDPPAAVQLPGLMNATANGRRIRFIAGTKGVPRCFTLMPECAQASKLRAGAKEKPKTK